MTEHVATLTVWRPLSRAEWNRVADMISAIAADIRKGSAPPPIRAGQSYPVEIVADGPMWEPE